MEWDKLVSTNSPRFVWSHAVLSRIRSSGRKSMSPCALILQKCKIRKKVGLSDKKFWKWGQFVPRFMGTDRQTGSGMVSWFQYACTAFFAQGHIFSRKIIVDRVLILPITGFSSGYRIHNRIGDFILHPRPALLLFVLHSCQKGRRWILR